MGMPSWIVNVENGDKIVFTFQDLVNIGVFKYNMYVCKDEYLGMDKVSLNYLCYCSFHDSKVYGYLNSSVMESLGVTFYKLKMLKMDEPSIRVHFRYIEDYRYTIESTNKDGVKMYVCMENELKQLENDSSNENSGDDSGGDNSGDDSGGDNSESDSDSDSAKRKRMNELYCSNFKKYCTEEISFNESIEKFYTEFKRIPELFALVYC
jgi:hypothetical protein